MRISQLSLRNFRNISRADLAIPPSGFALIGENGQGKTNILEAIHYFHLMRSLRGARDQELIQFDEPAFHIAGTVENWKSGTRAETSSTISVGFERRGKRKKIVKDGKEIGRVVEAFGSLPSIVISPKDAELVSGGPALRRTYLDILLSLTVPGYLSTLQQYRANLMRRNAALRNAQLSGARDLDPIAAWEPALAQLASYIYDVRHRWVVQNTERFSELGAAIGERHPVSIKYSSSFLDRITGRSEGGVSDLKMLFEAQFEEIRVNEVRRGSTQIGPHRDDLQISLGGRDLRTYGSGGQLRTAAIALRILELRSVSESLSGSPSVSVSDSRSVVLGTGEISNPGPKPILLLDDPFAELDVRRSRRILSLLQSAGIGQTVITVPRADDLPEEFQALERWSIEGGVISGASDGVSRRDNYNGQ